MISSLGRSQAKTSYPGRHAQCQSLFMAWYFLAYLVAFSQGAARRSLAEAVMNLVVSGGFRHWCYAERAIANDDS